MLKLMASRKLQTALLALGVVGGLAIGTGVVLAWGPNYPDGTSAISGSNVRMYGFDQHDFVIDTDNDSNHHNEVVLYLWHMKGGISGGQGTHVGNQVFEDRAEIMVYRHGEHTTSTNTNEEADAWIQSSGNARVRAQSDGDVVITLGD